MKNGRLIYLISLLITIFAKQGYSVELAETKVPVGLPADSSIVYVAIITQPNRAFGKILKDEDFYKKNSSVAASYSKYVESSSAQPLLIPWDLPWPEMVKVLKQTHGMMLPGGGYDIYNQDGDPYNQKISKIIDWATQRNKDGYIFFIFAICQGLNQMLIKLANNDPNIVETDQFNDHGAHPIKLESEKDQKNGFENFAIGYNKSILEFFAKSSAMYSHNDGLSKDKYLLNPMIRDQTTLLGTSTTSDHQKFVSILQANEYPYLMVQFHPEKTQFENKAKKNFLADHSTEADRGVSRIM